MDPRRLCALAAAVAVATGLASTPAGPAVAAVPSQAVTPIAIGDGLQAAVTVDQAGNGHIAFIGPENTTTSLHYCKLPRGASSCAVQTTIAAPGTSITRPYVVVNGNTVQVISYRYGLSGPNFAADILFTSTDGGASFDGGVEVGVNPFSDAALGPGNAVSTTTYAETGGMSYQRLPLDGSSAGATRAVLSTDHPYTGAVGLLDPNTPLATMDDGSDNLQFRRYTGSGDPNDAANWTPPQDVGSVRNPHIAAGPGGFFLIGGAPDRTLQARAFNGTAFGGPVSIAGETGETPQAHPTQDASGRLHVLLPQITANGSRLLYATSDNGVNWEARQFAFEPFASQTWISVAPDHHGFAGWESTDSSGSKKVYALPVGPSAAVPTVGQFVGASLVSGTVLIKTSGSKGFVQLRADDVIPVGSTVDATGGRVKITEALPGGKTQSSDFYEGAFKVTQARNGLATMVMTGGSFAKCPRGRGASAAKAKVIRHLWGSGSGKFRTKGRYASATIRGTVWDVVDRCDGTLTVVKQGSVVVSDFKRHQNVVVKKGRSYLARA
jgi:hypothetical protein